MYPNLKGSVKKAVNGTLREETMCQNMMVKHFSREEHLLALSMMSSKPEKGRVVTEQPAGQQTWEQHTSLT